MAIAPPVAAALWWGPPLSDLVVIVVGVLGVREFAAMAAGGRLSTWSIAGLWPMASVAASVVCGAIWQRWDLAFLVAVAGAGTSVLVARAVGLVRHVWVGIGALYVAVPCCALVWLRDDTVQGRDLVLWLLVMVWVADSAAFFVGRRFGRAKLAPRISPGKTWEGLFGAIGITALGGLASALVIADAGAAVLMVAAVGVALVSQAGDLLESWFKRFFGFKDSGRMIPGHGGVLDRVDGLLAVVAVAGLIVWAMADWGPRWP